MKLFPEYLSSIARANGLGNSVQDPGNPPAGADLAREPVTWLFYPGMLQDSFRMWWADFGVRHACHEGIDICFYRAGPAVSALPPGALVPAVADGRILNITPDLLGTTLAVAYEPDRPDRSKQGKNTGSEPRPVLVYSHLVPEPGLSTGALVRKGQIIARTFDARTRQSRLLSHLHLSCILVPETCAGPDLNWDLFADRKRVAHVNPVFL